MTSISSHERIRLIDISPRNWEHPADKAALVALKKLPGFDKVLAAFLEATIDRRLRLQNLASSVRVTETQFPEVHKLVIEACEILDIKEVPEVFVEQSPTFNARAVGASKPFMVLNSSLVESFDKDQLIGVIGHELGHIASGHVLYSTLLLFLDAMVRMTSVIPFGGIPFQAIRLAMLEWSRKAELTADRAELLVTQDPKHAYNVLLKLAGGKNLEQMNLNEFFRQAAEYEKGEKVQDSVYKFIDMIMLTHPQPVVRLTELKTWVDSGKFNEILSGNYIRRSNEEEYEEVFTSATDASSQYTSDMKNSKDPMYQAVGSIFEAAGNVASRTGDFFSDIINGKDDSKQ